MTRREVDADNDGRGGGNRLQVGGEPGELVGADPAFVSAVGGDADGVEHDEVNALVVKRVEKLAEVVFEVLLATTDQWARRRWQGKRRSSRDCRWCGGP